MDLSGKTDDQLWELYVQAEAVDPYNQEPSGSIMRELVRRNGGKPFKGAVAFNAKKAAKARLGI